MSVDCFIRDYVQAINNGRAAVFAGAGMSMPSGYVNWKNLMHDIAKHLGLDVDKESDLTAVAQYYLNDQHRRTRLNQLLVDEFAGAAGPSENHKILARLPIEEYWTTNYDTLIEQSLKEQGKIADVKRTVENFAYSVQGADAIVYKMHGDVLMPDEAVITKDDYETYEQSRGLFSIALKGALAAKTFLFIGLSFSDPNLNYILARIRALLGQNVRDHYCFVRRVSGDDYSTDDEYQYDMRKQELMCDDLKRYGITALLVDEYEDITRILAEVETQVLRTNVFISGSATTYGLWDDERARRFLRLLTHRLIDEGFSIISGFGLGVGSSVIEGAVETLWGRGKPIGRALDLRPFPQDIEDATKRQQMWQRYREEILRASGIAIFVFGNKVEGEPVCNADGVLKEFRIAHELGVTPIPIAVTQFAAKSIWKQVMEDFSEYVPDPSLRDLYKSLAQDELEDEQIIENVVTIAKRLANAS